MSHYDRFYSFSKPLIESLKETFFIRYAFKALIQDPKKKTSTNLNGDVNSCLVIKGKVDINNAAIDFAGHMVITYPMATFFKLANLKEGDGELDDETLNIAKDIANDICEQSVIELTEHFQSLSDTNVTVCLTQELNFEYPLPGETILMEVISKFGVFGIEFSYVEG